MGAWGGGLGYAEARHYSTVHSIALSPDDRYMASGSYDKTVVLWDVATGQRIRVLGGHEDAVHSVAWSRDGRYIVSGSADKTLLVWEADVQVRMHVRWSE